MNLPIGSPQPPRVLLVEGDKDKHVVVHLRQRHPSTPAFCVVDKGGIDSLLPSISLEVRVQGREVVGIMADADDNVMGRWNAIRHHLSKLDIPAPASPEPTGMVLDGANGTPRIGVWLMPDNESPGELEDFVVKMIPDGDPVWPLARGYIGGIPKSARKFSDKKQQRAEIYAWLAARKDPRLMGQAIGAGDLKVAGVLSQKFIDWLAKLFG